jgi:hypothetical protein
MNHATIVAAYAAFLPATAALFLWKGPRVASPIALFAGFLLLPRASCEGIVPVLGGWINKLTVPGLALLVGIVVSDGRRLLRARPRPLDVSMIAFVLLPLVSFAANAFEEPLVSLSLAWTNFAGWSLPYLAGRLYFGDRDGPARLTRAVALAGLASIPIFAFEMVAGPRFYVARLVYGIEPLGHMVSRLGGWRPEGFQVSGLEVATWLALASTTSAWSWLRGAWPARKSIAWLPTAALTVATVACRGVYGYLDLSIGLAAAAFTHLTRSRVLLVALACVPPAYIGARLTGSWAGQPLVDLVQFTGRSDTVAYRLRAEEAYIKKVFDHGPVLGFGGRNSAIFDWTTKNHLWPDGWWIHQLRTGGLVGLVVAVLALFLLPAGLGLALPADRSGRASPGALAWGLALFLILHMIDNLQNMNYVTASPMIGGSLVGLFLSRRSARVDVPPPSRDGSSATADPSRVPLLVTVVILIGIEILGRIPRTSPPLPGAPSPGDAPAKTQP